MGRVDDRDDSCADASGGMTCSAALPSPSTPTLLSLSRFLRRWGNSRSDTAGAVPPALAGVCLADHDDNRPSFSSNDDEPPNERLAEKYVFCRAAAELSGVTSDRSREDDKKPRLTTGPERPRRSRHCEQTRSEGWRTLLDDGNEARTANMAKVHCLVPRECRLFS